MGCQNRASTVYLKVMEDAMKRLLPLLAVAAVLISPLWSQDLDESELKSVDIGTVEFVNYEGPHDRIDSLSQILGIGRSLASGMSGGSVLLDGKYRIKRIYDAEQELLSADIFILEASAQVDHIRNLRRILAAYIEQAYGYSFEEAELLAEFASYYNAVHRGDAGYFSSSYQPMVVSFLDPAKAGLATVYSQWPGNTQLLLPLTAAMFSDGEGKIATDALTGDEVINELRGEEDKGIPERKEMTELKEREIEEDQGKIEEAKDALAEEKSAIEEDSRQIIEDKSQLEEDKAQAKEISNPEERAAREEELAAREDELAKREEDVQKRQEDTAAKEEDISKAEADVQQRVERIRDEREGIAGDERGIIEERAADKSEQVPFLYLVDKSAGLRQLINSDSKSGSITRRSGINTIHSRDLAVLGDAYLVIAGESGGNRAIRLVSIDPESFEMNAQGDTDMFAESFILVDGRRVFGVIDDNGYKIGRFNGDLQLEAASEAGVLPQSWLSLKSGALYAQADDGSLLVLDPETLQSIAE